MADRMLVNLVQIYVNSTGSGALKLGQAVAGYRGVEALTNGGTYGYSIQQGSKWEFGQGVYLQATAQLTRQVIGSSAGNGPIDLSPNAQIAFTVLAEDLEVTVGVPLSGDGPPADGLGLVGQGYYDVADPLNPIFYGPKQPSGWGVGVPIVGPAGPAVASFDTLSGFKAAPVTNRTQYLRDPSIRFGQFSWQTADAPYTADDVNVIKADSTSLSVGAWVRQTTNSLSFDQVGDGTITRPAQDKLREILSAADFGAIGDGTAHPLSERFATVADAQAVFPFVSSLTQTIDWAAIRGAIRAAYLAGGAKVLVGVGVFILSDAIIPTTGVTLSGAGVDRTILKAQDGSVDNVVGIDYLVEGEVAARAAGKTLNRLSSPGFGPDLTEQQARETGGYAGYGAVDWWIEDLTIDGNKDNCPENGNFIAASGGITGTFLSGQTVTSSSGGSAMCSAVFAAGSPPGISIRPSTTTSTFQIGDTVTGPSGSLVITGRQGDDAYQNGAIFQAVTRGGGRRIRIINSVFQGSTVYNFANGITFEDCTWDANNKAGTVYTGGNVQAYSDFDCNGIRYVRCQFIGGGGYGVVFGETGGTSTDMTVEDCNFLNVPGDCIRIEAKNTQTMRGFKVKGNYIQGGGGSAVHLVGSGSLNGIYGAVVEGNTVHNCLYGILLNGRVYSSAVADNALTSITNQEVNFDGDWNANKNTSVGNTGEKDAYINRSPGSMTLGASGPMLDAKLNVVGGNGIFCRTQYALSGAAGVDIARGAGFLVLIRDDINGATCLALYENGAAPFIIQQSAGSHYVTSGPTGSQVAIDNRTGGNGIAAYMAVGQSTTLNVAVLSVDNA